MRLTRSISARLSLVLLSLLLLTIIVGLFSIESLRYFNRVSSQVQERWLPSTRVLGDLNNFTSDFRAAEGASLLVAERSELAARQAELGELDRSISKAQQEYRLIPHEPTEDSLYARFAGAWEQYREVVRRVQALARAGSGSAAVDLFNAESKRSYDKASDILALLTERNVVSAREATLRAQAAYSRGAWLIVGTMLLAGLAVAAATFYVRRSISAPLLCMAVRMHQLASNETAVSIQGTERSDEIGDMARAVVVFRDNAVELLSARRGLEQQATMLQERLAEERRLMQLQRNFVSMASHELRTPLALIDAQAQRLIRMKDRLTAADLMERAGQIRGAVLRITHFIDHLIDSARVLDGEVELYFHPAPVDLRQLLIETCQLHREITPGVRIEEQCGDRPISITGDGKLLVQVFGNLISNAIKYSPRERPIRVSLSQEVAQVRVTVEDEGVGIPEHDRERVFDRYYRAANAAGVAGTGVGLYFAKTVVSLHGGEIQLASNEGVGSRFTVVLPLSSARTESSASAGEAAA